METSFEKVKILDMALIANNTPHEFVGERRYLTTGHLEGNQIIGWEDVTYLDKPSRANLDVQVRDVILARMKNTRKVLMIDKANSDFIVSTGFIVLRPKERLDSRYLAYYLSSESFQDKKDQLCTGATQKAINNSNFEKLQIPLPPLSEQKKIVQELDKVSSLIKKRKESIDLLDKYLKSVFLDMFGDPVSNTKNLPQKQIDAIGDVITGSTPSRKMASYYGDYIEWIKSDNLNNDNYYLTRAVEYLSKEGAKKGRLAPPGSVLVTCIAGSLDCIGNSGIADREVSFNQQINAIVPNKNLITTEFLFSQIMYGKKLFRDASTNSMKGMLNKSNFSKIQLIVPSFEDQKVFSTVFNKVDRSKRRMKEQLLLLNDNFQMQLNRL